MAEVKHIPELEQRIDELEHALNLKQLQINRLLTLTQAINNNIKFDDLFLMFREFMSWELGITRMVFYVRSKDDQNWVCAVIVGLQEAFVTQLGDIGHLLNRYEKMTKLVGVHHPFLKEFDLVIPVMHKDRAIAYTLLGHLEQDDSLYSKIQFITAITNVVAVALENKRLFKRQLEQERLKREMELASDIQMMLVPSVLPQSPHFELASIYKPQLGIGGDYFDFIHDTPDLLRFCVADISGKGLAAAMVMSNFQANLHSLLIQDLPIDVFVHRLNSIVFRMTGGSRFITMFYGEYHIPERKLHYVNAGHVPPVLHSPENQMLLESGCTILGSFDMLPSLETGIAAVPPGSLLFSYTDGLTDLMNRAGTHLSEQRLYEFTKEHGRLNVVQFNTMLTELMETYRDGQPYPDDVTVLTCRFH